MTWEKDVPPMQPERRDWIRECAIENFERGLYDLDRIWVVRETDAETVVGEGCVDCDGGCILVGVGCRVL
jgi:hypothetical protein